MTEAGYPRSLPAVRRAIVLALIVLSAAFGPATLLSHLHAGADAHAHGLGLDHLPVHHDHDHDHGEDETPVLECGFDYVPAREGQGIAPLPPAVVPDAARAAEVGIRFTGAARPWRPPVATGPAAARPSLRAPPR